MKAQNYLINVILSILLVFTLLGSAICIISKNIVLNNTTCIKIIDDKQLSESVKTTLNNYFKDKYNATGIPTEVYMDILTTEWIDDTIKNNINSGFDYINNRTDSFDYSPDYSALNKNISQFFSDYADENGFSKDSSYEDKLNTEINNAQSIINTYTDIFKFRTLNNEGILNIASKAIRYLSLATTVCILISALLIILLAISCRKKISDLLYWLGCNLSISAIIGIVPCIYLTSTKYFDSFVIKQQQIFIAFTTYMYKIIDIFTTVSIVTLIFGIALILLKVFINKKQNSNVQ